MARGDTHHDPTVARVVAMNYAMCDQSLNGINGFLKQSQQPNYDLMYPTPEESNADKGLKNRTQTYYYNHRDTNGGRFKALNCIRAAEANADAANGQVLHEVFEGKRLVDLADNITAVPSLSTDDISAYAFVNRTTGELVESTADRRRQVEEALAARAPFAENGGSIFDGANSGAAAPAAMPAPSAVPIEDVLGVLAISFLPPSTQHGSVRDALRNNPSAVAFAAMSEEMAQQQAATAAAAATLPSGGAVGSGSGAWSGMGSGGLIERSEDDLLGMLAHLPASVLNGSVRDALRIDPSGLRLAAIAMWMLKEKRQGQMQT